jgi:D-amino-acid oxidase
MKLAIVGGGVIGLSVANHLCDLGYRVTLFSPQPIEDITSYVAAAYWAPHWIGHYDRNIAVVTLQKMQELAADGVAGVSIVDFEEWLTVEGARSFEEHVASTYWRHLPGINFRKEPMPEHHSIQVSGKDITFVDRLRFQSVVARMPDYLAWLEHRALQSGRVDFRRTWVDSLDAVSKEFDTVIHCTGWGAKQLAANDPATANMKLLAGHVVLVECPSIQTGTLLHGEPFDNCPVYVVPRQGSTRDVLCGGTAIEVTELPNVREPLTFQKDAQCNEVIRRAKSVLPPISSAPEVGRGVGIRPVRDSLRLERDPQNRNLIHCYGHGGSGMTLSWGSAMAVASLLDSN